MSKKILAFFKRKYVAAITLTIIIFLGGCLLRGVYPFAKHSLSINDLNQSYVTFYHYLYDIFWSNKSIFYSFALGAGSNVFGGIVVDGFFNPTAWLIVLSSRSNIMYNMTFIILVKFIVIAITTTLFINKVFPKTDHKIQLLATMMYTFGGFTLLNYCNLMWLDIVALFPLLCLGIYDILKYNKMTLFTVVLGICLINNYNLSYMLLFFLIFAVPFAIKYLAVNKRKATSQIILGCILAIGLSAWAFVPAFIQTMSSYRMSGAVTNSDYNLFFFYKLATGCFYVLPILYLIRLVKDYKKDIIAKMLTGMTLVVYVLPVIFEKINLLWHTGSYQSYPFRYGFIINFILIITLIYGYQKYKLDVGSKLTIKGSTIFTYIYLAITILFLIVFCYYMNNDIHTLYQLCFKEQILAFIIIFFVTFILTMIIISNNKEEKAKNYLLILTIILAIGYLVGLLGKSGNYNTYEFSDKAIINANKLYNELKLKDDYRIKDTTITMTENYPVVIDQPSNSTYLHIISPDQVNTYNSLGYSSKITKLNDLGGTLIGDTFYGIKYIISDKKINNNIYKFAKKVDNYYLYVNPYVKFIYPVDKVDKKIINKDVFETNNNLAKNFLGSKMLTKLTNNCLQNGKTITCSFKLDKDNLYFYSLKNIDSIMVNNKMIKIPYIGYKKTYSYNRYLGIADLGYYNDMVTITIKGSKLKISDLSFAKINTDNYKEIMSNKETINYKYDRNKLIINYNNINNKKGLLIPINYDSGFRAKINGKDVKIEKKLDNFMYIKLNSHKNKIVLTFYPKGYFKSLIASIITLIITIMMGLYEHYRKKDREIKAITYPLFIIGIIIVGLATIKVYLIPIIQTILELF